MEIIQNFTILNVVKYNTIKLFEYSSTKNKNTDISMFVFLDKNQNLKKRGFVLKLKNTVKFFKTKKLAKKYCTEFICESILLLNGWKPDFSNKNQIIL